MADTHEDEARALIKSGFYQISRKYRGLARLPDGKTGREAYMDASRPTGYNPHLSERYAGDQYLRVYAPKQDRITVSFRTFQAFRRLGGDSYDNVFGRGGYAL